MNMEEFEAQIKALMDTAGFNPDGKKLFNLVLTKAFDLAKENKTYRDALEQAIYHCGCSFHEKQSGHKTDCPAVDWIDILDNGSPDETTK